MKGFSKYRAQLDNKSKSHARTQLLIITGDHLIPLANTTGEYSVYTEFEDNEIMFHVSTLLPYTATNKQQVLKHFSPSQSIHLLHFLCVCGDYFLFFIVAKEEAYWQRYSHNHLSGARQ